MNQIVDEAAGRLAQTLRLERESRGWSQGELAERAGVSKAMISKIERVEASPTATILVRLSGAFELTLGTLLTKAEGNGGRHVAAAAQAVWRDPGTGYVRRQLFANATSPIELVRVELPAGARLDSPAASYRFIRQVVWVMEGRLVVEDGGQRFELGRGDTYAFGEPADAALVNEGRSACTYVVAVSRR